MPIKIVLRNNNGVSKFRRLLHGLILAPKGDSILLCSGYIWQPGDGGWNVLDDNLKVELNRLNPKPTLTTIAGKLTYNYYQEFYENFVAELRADFTVTAYKARRNNWHAKVAIKLENDIPKAILIGSSNLTRPAYGENVPNWNFECDVLLWENDLRMDRHFNTLFADLNQEFGIISAIIDTEKQQPSINDQMQKIYNDLKAEMENFEQI